MTVRKALACQLGVETVPASPINSEPSCDNDNLSVILFPSSKERVNARLEYYRELSREASPVRLSPPDGSASPVTIGGDMSRGATPSEWCHEPNDPCESGNTPKRTKLSKFYVFDTATLFYGKPTDIRTFYRAIFWPGGSRGYYKIMSFETAKKLATMNDICKFPREYHDFAINSKPIIPFAWADAIVCMARWYALIHKRGPSAPRMGRYPLMVFGEALGPRPPNKPRCGYCGDTHFPYAPS